MADLSVEFAGVVFKNPVLVACSSLGNHITKLRRLAEAGAGGVITKLISGVRGPLVAGHDFQAVVFDDSWAVFGDRRLGLEQGMELIKQARKEFEIPVIANFAGEKDDEDNWAETAIALQEAGADMLEMDTHPPVLKPEGDASGFRVISLGHDPVLLGKVVKAVKQAVDIPVMVKLDTKAVDNMAVVEACVQSGADAISLINAMRCLAGIDITKGGRPLYLGLDKQYFSAYMGAALNPVAILYTALLAESVDLPLSSGGGVMSWENAVQRLMLGATTVQLCSALYLHGLEALTDCVRGIENYLNEYGYDDCSEIIGQALEHIVPMEQLVFHELKAVIVDEEKCLDCEGPCIKRTSATCLALTREDSIPSINLDQCTGCSLCYWFCPYEAIEMERR
jgi:dihydropyrimidine dehydrogenase (NAD+) subunit PreA